MDNRIHSTRTEARLGKHADQGEACSRALDAEAALGRVDGNRELLRPMVAVFAMQWRKLADEIVKAMRDRAGAELEMIAHRLKESVASFGAREVSRVAQELAMCGRADDFHDPENTCASLHMAIDRLVNGLKELTRERPVGEALRIRAEE